jgi:hypothetical protein
VNELITSGLGAGGGVGASFFLIRWVVSNEVRKSEDKIKKELISYVDKKHTGVVDQLNDIKEMLNRIDQRMFEIIKNK